MTGAAVLLALALAMPSFSLVDRLVFHPSPGVDLEPAKLGIHAEEVFLEAEDGTRIHAFVLPHEGATRAFLFLHGNAGNASHRLPNAALLQRMGATVLLLDYRGYGRSEGRPTEAGVYADARAGLVYLVGRLGVPEERVVVFGRSLGGAVAVELARDRPLAGVILESTFTSFHAMVRQIVGTGFGRLTRGRFDALAKIGEVRAPLCFFHGDRDEVVPYAFGRELYEAAPEPKHFTTIRGAGHNDTVQVGGPGYLERIAGFLEEVAPR
ncbi:MAG: alpha/beta hydrolase [Deltaproteobacteria bacterium]|nr:alpha/beta hydrolase [Deltaproteobacteria bacterium]